MSLSYLHIKNPKDDETSIEAQVQVFASLFRGSHSLVKHLFSKPPIYSFEIYLIDQTVQFYVVTDQSQENYISSLITSAYPKSIITKTTDPLDNLIKEPNADIGELALGSAYYLPLKTYSNFSNVDPLASHIGFLGKLEPGVNMCIQIVTGPASFNWQNAAISSANYTYVDSKGSTVSTPGKSLILDKASIGGGKVAIRVAAFTKNPNPSLLPQLAGTFGAFSLGEGNYLKLKKPGSFSRAKALDKLKTRSLSYWDNKNQILNAKELATLWHLPGKALAGLRNVSWGKTLAGEPPQNLPTPQTLSDEDKQDTNFFAKTDYKNTDTIYGVKTPDRRKHFYIIGKTGTGKSTLIANMAIDDIRKGRGVGVIDPHGDLSETILEYIPNRRVNDVIYLEPFDPERAFSLNVLEVTNNQQKDLVASGIVAIFYKLYGNSWGPRLEYILRNVILTLLEIPNSTLVDVMRLLTDTNYQKRVLADHIKDPVLKSFWEKEFMKMSDSVRVEAISPIQNKVGRFVQSTLTRNIIGQSKSTINLANIMDEGKIFILNLSQGKLGEDNAALLGAMFITQLQLAAMNRSFRSEEERKDFFLYVDEFQNFATTSFIKILSEARKYRLSLILANQYIDQLDPLIARAIFGNVGTLASFVLGATDARILSNEFGGLYTDQDLVSLGKYEIINKLSVDGMTSSPFPARTLPLPSVKNENRQKIIQLSKERYARKVASIESRPKLDLGSIQNDQKPQPSVEKPIQNPKPSKAPEPQS